MTMRAGARTRQLRQFAAEGLDVLQIAERIGMKPWRVREYARKHGIEVIDARPVVKYRADLIRELAARELSVAEIAERLGIKPHRVRDCARRRGIALPESAVMDIEITWRESESFELDDRIRAERKPKPKGYADPELARACKAIMAYPLKSRTRFLDIDRSTKGGAWRA